MIRVHHVLLALSLAAVACREVPDATVSTRPLAATQAALDPTEPTWWAKYQHLAKNGPLSGGAATGSTTVGPNVDVSNECGPQSETF
ncbi:MAG TPA: hypothetical protein VH137_09700, partial [Gemmatimonadales bacterium]|nr:hypothetical protein [Gemmatimonadales bacterium]